MRRFRPIHAEKKLAFGQSALELIITLAVLLPIIFGGIEFARAVSIRQSLSNGVYLAARAISTDPTGAMTVDAGTGRTYAQTLVYRSLQADVFGAGGVSPATINYGSPTWDDPVGCASPTLGCTFSYSASLTFVPVIPLFSESDIPISATHFGLVEIVP